MLNEISLRESELLVQEFLLLKFQIKMKIEIKINTLMSRTVVNKL